MNPRNLTRETIEELNDIEPYCFETDREEQWFNVGLQYGLDIADSEPISPWISVENDLPCNHKELISTHINLDYEKETVLVFTVTSKGIIDTDYMVYDNYDGWFWKYGLPKYWMPMPKLPKEIEY